MPTAILVDGGFFLKRFRGVYRDVDPLDPKVVAQTLFHMAVSHLWQPNRVRRDLYRIFFYDCPPIMKKAHQPVSNRAIDFAKSDVAVFRLGLHNELRKLRKVALRLGQLSEDAGWTLKSERQKDLLKGDVKVGDLTDDDFSYDARQKGVDMRVGIDIASLTFKRQVDQIVLIAGDADFVPAAKLARREGIDFILDPMWARVHASLNEHIDGLRSTCPNPAKRGSGTPTPLPGGLDPTELVG